MRFVLPLLVAACGSFQTPASAVDGNADEQALMTPESVATISLDLMGLELGGSHSDVLEGWERHRIHIDAAEFTSVTLTLSSSADLSVQIVGDHRWGQDYVERVAEQELKERGVVEFFLPAGVTDVELVRSRFTDADERTDYELEVEIGDQSSTDDHGSDLDSATGVRTGDVIGGEVVFGDIDVFEITAPDGLSYVAEEGFESARYCWRMHDQSGEYLNASSAPLLSGGHRGSTRVFLEIIGCRLGVTNYSVQTDDFVGFE